VLSCVLQEQLKSVLTRFFAKVRKNGNVPADDGLKCRSEISDYAARAHHDSSNNSKIPDNPVSGQLDRRSDHPRIDS
jgi:hypothetical protein